MNKYTGVDIDKDEEKETNEDYGKDKAQYEDKTKTYK